MNRQISLGSILQYVQMALSIIISLVYTPFMLKILGQSEYGLYNLAISIVSYLSLFSLGLGASYIRFYSIYKKNKPDKIASLNGLYFVVFCGIGIVALIAGLILSFNVKIFFNETYTQSNLNTAKYLMILLSINLAISFPMSLFSGYVISQEQFVFEKLLNMGKTILSPILSIVALYFGYGSVGLVAITIFVSITVDIINVLFCFKKLKMKIAIKGFEKGLFKDIFVFSIFIAINQIIDQINWQTDKVILGRMISSSAVSIYAIGAIFNTYFIQFSTAISSLFSPRINRIVSEGKATCDLELTNLMTKVGRIQFFVLFFILSGFIFFGQFFINHWAGPGYEQSYYVALLLMVPEIVPLIQNTGIEIQRAKNKHQFRSIIYLIMAFINVGISILCCYYFGVVGVAFGTTISIIVANIIIMNIYYEKNIKIDMAFFWKNILKTLPSTILPIAIGVLLMINGYSNWLTFIKSILSFSSIYLISVGLVGLNKQEKEYMKKVLKI